MKYGLQVTGIVRAFSKTRKVKSAETKKEYTITDHWLNVSEKDENGVYFNKGMTMIFGREAKAVPNNNELVCLDDAFPMITGTGDYRRIALFVRAWHPATPEELAQ